MTSVTPYSFEQALPFGYQAPDRPSLGAFTPQTASSIAAAGASITTGIMGTLGALTAGSSIAGPIGIAIAGAAALAVAIYNVFKGCGQTCTITSDIANQIEPILRQNLDNYMSAPVHYASLQAAAINNFQTAWNALAQACNNPTYAQAGQNCIADRQQGACHYTTSPGGWSNGTYTAPGQNGSGPACWNWFVGYLDPIRNDPTVVPDPVSGGTSASSWLFGGSSSTSSTSIAPLLLILAVAAGVMLL